MNAIFGGPHAAEKLTAPVSAGGYGLGGVTMALRAACVASPLFLADKILSRMWETNLLDRPSSAHLEVERAMIDQASLLYVDARGTAKTTLLDEVGTVWQLLKYVDDSILLTHSSTVNVKALSASVRLHFVRNPDLKALFPEYAIDDRQGEGNILGWSVPCRTLGGREESVECGTPGSQMAGRHYTVVRCTDWMNENTTPLYGLASLETMKGLVELFSQVQGLLKGKEVCPRVHFTADSNRWHDGDLAGTLIRRDEGVDSIRKVVRGVTGQSGSFVSSWPEVKTPEMIQAIYDSPTMTSAMFAANFRCTPSETPVLMADWTEKRIEDVKVGDVVTGFNFGVENKFAGKLRESVVTQVFSKLDEVFEYGLESGRFVRCTADHKWFTGRLDSRERKNGHKVYRTPRIGMKLVPVREAVVEPMQDALKESWAYLAGVVDGEGHCGPTLAISQSPSANPAVYQRIGEVLSRLGLSWKCFTGPMWNRDGPHQSKQIGVRGYFNIHKSRSLYARLLRYGHTAKSAQMLKRVLHSRWRGPKDRIVSCKSLGFQRVHALQTETGNYVAWGYASSNSDPLPDSGMAFKRQWLLEYKDMPAKIAERLGLLVAITVDPAFTEAAKKKRHSDRSGVVVSGVSPDTGDLYVLQIKPGYFSVNQLCDVLFGLSTVWKPQFVGIEKAPGSLSITTALRNRMARTGERLPLIDLDTGNHDKNVRMGPLHQHAERQGLYVRLPDHVELVEELLRFGVAEHDDLADALAHRMFAAWLPHLKRSEVKPILTFVPPEPPETAESIRKWVKERTRSRQRPSWARRTG